MRGELIRVTLSKAEKTGFGLALTGLRDRNRMGAFVCGVRPNGAAHVEGSLRPSSDTPTHRYLYQAFAEVGGVVHTHSTHATAWAQAGRELPCLGTTHADHFHGPVPVTRQLTQDEVEEDYEANTGKVIVRCFGESDLSPVEMPAVLVRGHAPFTWGRSVRAAYQNAVVLEEVARSALATLQLNPELEPLVDYVLEKHYERKHGAGAYYGQKREEGDG